MQAMIAAISKSQAIVEFSLDGTILHANDNFLQAMGYTLEEVKGNRHSMFVDAQVRGSSEYRAFWEKLGRGEYDSGQYKRYGKGGREVWIQASYNPIFDAAGKPYKVVKYATDITEQKRRTADFEGQLSAISKSQAVIEFSLEGRILSANENFLATVGYSVEEVRGMHHSMFVEPSHRSSAEYRLFWEKLGRGEYDAGQYKRVGKGGKEVWIQASYNPILDLNGKPCKVVKFATDITEQKRRNADYEGQLAAISKSQAVIEFNLEGRILHANQNFLDALGYTLDEVRGMHHSMFVDATYRGSAEYRLFWEKLGRGEYDAGQYKRFGKGGKEIWIQASYNPILDMNGRPYKVVKYATDVTAQVRAAHALDQAVRQTQEVVTAAQEGNLTGRVSMEGKSGQIAQLCEGVNALVENMVSIVRQTKEVGASVETAAKEITAGSLDLSSRTESQAASLEETASSMEELTSTVKQNAENARQANQFAIGASEVARKGGSAMGEVVSTMGSINQASKKIVDIIGVIDGIAFQTNILALNAAVEAARAGEQGRGFAVVASEVRNLAQRSAAAAKEIKLLINDSVEKVGNGTMLVQEAGKTMEEIVTSVKRVTDIMSEITAASLEQSSGIEQVGKAVTQMDETTQQNAALVEEMSAAARSLEEQSSNLVKSVDMFVLDKVEGAAVKPAAAVAPITMRSAPRKAESPGKAPPPARLGAVGSKRNGDARHHVAEPSARESWKQF